MGKTHRDIGVYTEGTLIALYVASGKIFRSLVASFQWEFYMRDRWVMSVPITGFAFGLIFNNTSKKLTFFF